ncbi:MAG: hypothetical protein MJA27_00375 [Pseudanabaenales cyanobacterium]|nr:hypothetical protein [Pseudanabaenales cyanobacterium]
MHKQLLLGCVLGLSVLQTGYLVSWAAPVAQSSTHTLLEDNQIEVADRLPAAIAQSLLDGAPAITDYETYVEPGEFSIDYPAGWVVERTDNNSVQITSYVPASERDPTQSEDIKTEVWLIPEDPAAVVDRALNDIAEDGSEMRNYSALMVDNQPALMLWLSKRPLDFPNAILTYVGYGNQETAVIVSSYTASNPNAEAVIQRIHASFNSQWQEGSAGPEE